MLSSLTADRSRWMRTSVGLLIANIAGVCVYVARASLGWTIPEERGLHAVTGEPFIWFLAILPVVAVFAVINLVWAYLIITSRQWRLGLLWLLTAVIWLIGIAIDFAHH